MKSMSLWWNKDGAQDFWVLCDGRFYLLKFEGYSIPFNEPSGFVKIGDLPK